MNQTHPLRIWRETRKISLGDFANRVNVEASHISMIERAIRGPSLALATRIQVATKGAVTPKDFLLVPTKKRRAA